MRRMRTWWRRPVLLTMTSLILMFILSVHECMYLGIPLSSCHVKMLPILFPYAQVSHVPSLTYGNPLKQNGFSHVERQDPPPPPKQLIARKVDDIRSRGL